jgi:excisionase family DNA binding protein
LPVISTIDSVGASPAMTDLRLTVTLTSDQLAEIAERVSALLADRDSHADHGGYLDAAGAAEYLATTRDRVYDLKQLGKLQAFQDGRRLLFRRSDLDRYLEAD